MITKCPHCKEDATIRRSEQVTAISREITFMCTDPDCGHTFISMLYATKTLSPSARPDPSVYLPFSNRVNKKQIISNIEQLPCDRQGELDV